jgi:hypothetical protein
MNRLPDDTDAIEVKGQWPIDLAINPALAIGTSTRFLTGKKPGQD